MQTSEYHIKRAMLHENEGDYICAEIEWRNAVQLMAQDGEIYYCAMEHLAYSLHKRGRTQSAIEVLKNLLRKMGAQLGTNNERCAQTINRLAGMYYFNNELHQAFNYCNDALLIYNRINDGRLQEATLDVLNNLALVQHKIKMTGIEFAPDTQEPSVFENAGSSTRELPKVTAAPQVTAKAAPKKSGDWKVFCDMEKLVQLCAA